jgi:orotate phosphoribosyltransferase
MPITPEQIAYIEFLVNCGSLKFGDFTTKSGRKTPFFINTGACATGAQMNALGQAYATAIYSELKDDFDVLYGPAYKGIPLCVATATAWFQKFNQDLGYTFNRKEIKDHGEGGSLVGSPIKDGARIVIVEDVVTAGTSFRESVKLLKSVADVTIAGLVVSVDRMERGKSEFKSALDEIQDEFGVKVIPVVTIEQVVSYLAKQPVNGEFILDEKLIALISEYRTQFGVKSS